MINVRIPMKLGDGQVEFLVRVSEEDAHKIVDAPRRTVRALDSGMFQVVRDGLRSFFDGEEKQG